MAPSIPMFHSGGGHGIVVREDLEMVRKMIEEAYQF